MSDAGARLAIYWRCYGCQFETTLSKAQDMGAVCCPECGMTLLLPTAGPLEDARRMVEDWIEAWHDGHVTEPDLRNAVYGALGEVLEEMAGWAELKKHRP